MLMFRDRLHLEYCNTVDDVEDIMMQVETTHQTYRPVDFKFEWNDPYDQRNTRSQSQDNQPQSNQRYAEDRDRRNPTRPDLYNPYRVQPQGRQSYGYPPPRVARYGTNFQNQNQALPTPSRALAIENGPQQMSPLHCFGCGRPGVKVADCSCTRASVSRHSGNYHAQTEARAEVGAQRKILRK